MKSVLMIFLLIAGSGYCISNKQEVWNAIDDFSSRHYKELINEQKGNGVYSPINTWGMIYQLRNITTNQTADQLQAVIYLNETTDSQITQEFYNNIPGVHIETTLLFDYEKISGLCYFFYCYDMDAQKKVSEFWKLGNITAKNTKLKNFEKAVESISKNTNSQIKQIITFADKEENIQVIGVDLFQFESMWADKFDVNKTKEQDFILNNGTVRSIPMMNKQGLYKHGVLPEISAEFIELSFENKSSNDSGLSMVVIVPEKNQNLTNFETKLINIKQSVFNSNYSTVDLYLPKFQITTKTDLKSSLNALGLNDMFNNSASFVTNELKLGKINKIIQETGIIINENGCNSLLSSESIVFKQERRSIPEGEKFLVNRPFFVLIRQRNNVILRSRIVDPSLSTFDYQPRTTEALSSTTQSTIGNLTTTKNYNEKIKENNAINSEVNSAQLNPTILKNNSNISSENKTINEASKDTLTSSTERALSTTKLENTTSTVNNSLITTPPTTTNLSSTVKEGLNNATSMTTPTILPVQTNEDTTVSNTDLNNPTSTGTSNVTQSPTTVSSGETSANTNKNTTNFESTTLTVFNTSPTTASSILSSDGFVQASKDLSDPMTKSVSQILENTSGANTNLTITTSTTPRTTTNLSSTVKEGLNNATSMTIPSILPVQTNEDTIVSNTDLNNPTSTGTSNVTQSPTTVSSGETSANTNKPPNKQTNAPEPNSSASHATIFPVALILMTTALFFA